MTTMTESTLDFLGVEARILSRGEDTNGALGLVDMVEPTPGGMPPLHVHHTHDEGFYVLEGSVTLFMPGREVELGPGEFVFAPRGIPHTYRVGDEPSRWLVTSTPAGFEQFVAEIGSRGISDPDELTQVAARYGIEILGPPGMLP